MNIKKKSPKVTWEDDNDTLDFLNHIYDDDTSIQKVLTKQFPKTFQITSNWFDDESYYMTTDSPSVGKREVLSLIKIAYNGNKKGMSLHVEDGCVYLMQQGIIIREWRKESPKKIFCYFENISELDLADEYSAIFVAFDEQKR